MKIIKCIAEHIAEEISDAEAYIDMAAQWKEEQPDAARVFADLSAEEMGHAEKLHEVVTDLIREYRDQHGDPPAGMMALYEYMHDRQLENSMRVKVKQKMYEEA